MPRNIPEADPDEPLETKPFKFVTGELPLLPLFRELTCPMAFCWTQLLTLL